MLKRRTVLIAFPGMQILDLTGPSSVYGLANHMLGDEAYAVTVAASQAGVVRSACGLEMLCAGVDAIAPDEVDGVFVVGGDAAGLAATANDLRLADWMRAAVPHAERYGSICSGAWLLAEWGLVGTRRIATHWNAVAQIRARHPAIDLDGEAIFVEDGPLWTSAGVTTGIDMTLAIVERDHGADIAHHIARRLVLSVRRPGFQSQFSPLIAAQASGGGRYAELISWIALHLDQDLGVEALAARAGQSPRNFHRLFTAAIGVTPAEFVRRLRLDRARDTIRAGIALKRVASDCGFGSPEHLSSSFRKAFGMSAGDYRAVHGVTPNVARQGSSGVSDATV